VFFISAWFPLTTGSMFRSWGEFNICAEEVFHLFAESFPANSPCYSSKSRSSRTSGEDNTTTLGLSRTGLECAFYVLFGRYPSPTLLTDCFYVHTAAASPQASPRVKSEAKKSSSGPVHGDIAGEKPSGLRAGRVPRACIPRVDFLRFVTLCAEEEGAGFVRSGTPAQRTADDQLGSSAAANPLPSEVERTTLLQCWRQFESVAGPKGYLTLQDMCTIPTQHPFQDAHAVMETPTLTAGATVQRRSSTEEFARRQAALVQHVFWIIDSDHDGKVRFHDVAPYLRGAV
jgi:hypothetical protein